MLPLNIDISCASLEIRVHPAIDTNSRGNFVIMCLNSSNAFYRCAVETSLLNIGSKIVKKLLKGFNYFSID